MLTRRTPLCAVAAAMALTMIPATTATADDGAGASSRFGGDGGQVTVQGGTGGTGGSGGSGGSGSSGSSGGTGGSGSSGSSGGTGGTSGSGVSGPPPAAKLGGGAAGCPSGQVSVSNPRGLPGGPPKCVPAPQEPGGPAAPPDPETVVPAAVDKMNLRAIDIGLTPLNHGEPDSRGIIGFPTWLWVEDPGESTVGPITASASSGGTTVTATGELDRIEWDMGDGTVVTCYGPGTPWHESMGKQDSPTCGHRYEKAGTYTVEARSFWEINWTGGGESGTITGDFASTTEVRMVEVQVIITN